MIKGIFVSVFVCLTHALSFVDSYQACHSPIIQVGWIDGGFLYIGRDAVSDHQPVNKYDIKKNLSKEIPATEGANTFVISDEAVVVGVGNRILNIDIASGSINEEMEIETHDEVLDVGVENDRIYAVSRGGKFCGWLYPHLPLFCTLAHAFSASTVTPINSIREVTTGLDRTVRIWDSLGQSVLTILSQNVVLAVASSETNFITADSAGIIKIYSQTYQLQQEINAGSSVISLQLVKQHIIAILALGEIKVYDVQSGQLLEHHRTDQAISSFSLVDGGFLTGHHNGEVSVWKL